MSTVHRTAHATFSRVWLKVKQRMCHVKELFIILAHHVSFAHVVVCTRSSTLRSTCPVLAHFPSLLLPSRGDNPIPPNPRTAGLFGRLAVQIPLTGYEPDAILNISSTEVVLVHHAPRRTSFCSENNSGEDATSAPVSSEVDERQSIGRLASPLLMPKREASAIPAIMYPSTEESYMSPSSHIPSAVTCCDTLTQPKVEQRHERREDSTSCRTHIFLIVAHFDHHTHLRVARVAPLRILKSPPFTTCFIDHSLMCLTHFLPFVPHHLRLHLQHRLLLGSGDTPASLRAEDYSLAIWSNPLLSQAMFPRPASTSAE